MSSEYEQLNNELLSHLAKRESFDANDTTTIICPSPVNLIGADYFESVKTVVDCNFVLTFFRNSSQDVKLYCPQEPGVFRIDPDNRYTDRSDYITSYSTSSVSAFRDTFEMKTGFTGAISLPFIKYPGLNDVQLKLSVFCALYQLNIAEKKLPNPRDEKTQSGLDRICSPAVYLSIFNGKQNCLISIDPTQKNLQIRTNENLLGNPGFILADIANDAPLAGENTEYTNYMDVLTLAGLICNAGEINSLSEIPREKFVSNIRKFPPDLRQYAEHYFYELIRTREALSHWKNNELSTLGNILSNSALSKCRITGNNQMIIIIKRICGIEGVYGTAIEDHNDSFRICILARADNVGEIINKVINDKEIPLIEISEFKPCSISDGISFHDIKTGPEV